MIQEGTALSRAEEFKARTKQFALRVIRLFRACRGWRRRESLASNSCDPDFGRCKIPGSLPCQIKEGVYRQDRNRGGGGGRIGLLD